jgi:hypothetical protein
MNLVQILLPAYYSNGKPIPRKLFAAERHLLTERFGGMTAYMQAPAMGLWKEGGKTVHDKIVVFEIMVKYIDRQWWNNYRHKLEKRFKQKTIVLRVQKVKLL